MLQLDRGRAMQYLTRELSSRGFVWAYRVVDSRSFGLPQRRKRVVLVASRAHDPREVVFADDAGPTIDPCEQEVACGFYWTEGVRGLGWAVDAIPTLKGGSTIGIPSPPAIRLPNDGGVVLPEIRDAERLQGFEPDWTVAASEVGRRRGDRWKLVGNAVSVPVSTWLGHRLLSPSTHNVAEGERVDARWPSAAWGYSGKAFCVEISQWPMRAHRPHLLEFLEYPTKRLSDRAARGFLARAARSSLRFPTGLLDAVAAQVDEPAAPVAA
jgi:DNA (cytosine-5)-methyltransferase 1